MILAALLAVICACGPINSPIPTGPLRQAERGVQTQLTLPPPPPVDVGLWLAPFAPAGLSDCDEMNFYRQQWGLPEAFAGIGWRESNCRNEDAVRTSCCHGYWQLHRIHFPKPECEAWTHADVNSDNPLEKQKQACAAKALFDIVGISAWSATS